MIYRVGSVLDTDAPALGHGVNCVGVMGAGVAAVIRARWPRMFPVYRQACLDGTLSPGGALPWATGEPGVKVVYNMASQKRPGRCARIDLVEQAGAATLRDASARGYDRVAIPKIGAGIGGLDWSAVQDVLARLEVGTGVQWEVWMPPHTYRS